MILTDLLAELSRRGITLWAENDRLRIRSPHGALTAELRDELTQHKQELLVFLRESPAIVQVSSMPLVPVSRDRELLLSSAQEELWLVDQLTQGDSAFKVASAYRLHGHLDLQALQWSLNEIVQRHETLRTTFTVVDNKPVQIVHENVSLPLQIINISNRPSAEQEVEIRQQTSAENVQPFDLTHGPLVRAHLFILNEYEHILHVAMHHIIFDAWSLGLFIKELAPLYSAACTGQPSPLPPLSIQYADFALWQRQWLNSEAITSQLSYWKNQLADAPAVLNLPLDHPRSSLRTFQRRQLVFQLSPTLTDALECLSRSEGTTLYTTLLAAFQALLLRYSGQKDILIGSPTSGRTHPATREMIGSFAYPLVMRTLIERTWTFQELLAKTRAVVLDAYAHQDVSFARVIEVAQPVRSSQYTPLFQVMFTFPPALKSVSLPDLELIPVEDLLTLTADYDLVLGMMEDTEHLHGRFIYNCDLFEDETISQMQHHFLALLEVIVANPQQPLAASSLFAEADGMPIEVTRVEEELCSLAAVAEGVVLLREKLPVGRELVAYVVPARTISAEQLHIQMQALLPAYMLPVSYVILTSLPLTSDGQLDEAILLQLDVVDGLVIKQWEARLLAVPEVECVSVLLQPYSEKLLRLHMKDVLPHKEVLTAPTGEQPATPLPLPVIQQTEHESRAICHGGPLDRVDMPTTLAEVLKRVAFQSSETGISYINTDNTVRFLSYAQLLQEAECILAGLRKLALQPQDTVIFQFDHNHDFIPALWGCILGGFVPVPTSVPSSYDMANSTASRLLNAWQMLEKPVILASASLTSALGELVAQAHVTQFRCVSIDQLRENAPDHQWHVSQAEDMALMMLTSGSTGMPKGVMLSHRNLLCRAAGSKQMNHFSSHDITLNWMPLDHVAGLIYFHLRDVFLGCQQFHAPTALVLQNPLAWIDWLDRYRITITFAPNFAFGLVNDHAEEMNQRHWDLSRVRFILNGAEAIVAKTARRFLQLLHPFALSTRVMCPAWGMSETSSGVVYSATFSLETTSDSDSFVEVGAPVPGLSLRIVDEQDAIVAETVIGRLQVQGLSVTSGYYHNPELNQNVFTTDGWFDTGDLGFLHNGCLTLTGRAKDVIVINSVNYYCHEIEAAVEAIGGVETSYTAACGILVPGSNTDRLAIFFHASGVQGDALLELIKEIRGKVVLNIGINPEYLLPVEKEAIPKTAIGKIQRVQLKQSFEAGEFDSILKQLDILSVNTNTLPDWFYRKIWRRKELRTNSSTLSGYCLLFLDRSGLGKQLYEQLHQHSVQSICVEIGTTFARIDGEHYSLDPANREHYHQLFNVLATEQIHVDYIVHLWTYAPSRTDIVSLAELEQAQTYGVFSLLYLVQAVAMAQGRSSEKTIRLLVGSSGVQPVEQGEAITYEQSPLVGLSRVITQELPWLDCRHIDLPGATAEQNAECLVHELRSVQRDQEVAYRHGQRFISRIVKVDMRQEPMHRLPFKAGGMYLLSGGLGGIGVEIARYLLKHHRVRLLLVGRTCIKEAEIYAQRLQALQQLEGDVLYATADVCDLDQLRRAVEEAKKCWHCELDGIIHLAGIFNEMSLVEETHETLMAGLCAKVSGTWNLHSLLVNEQPQGLFVHFSSINATFGGFGTGTYAAANRFLEHFSLYQRSSCAMNSYCFTWSMWNDVGVSENYQMKDFSNARGYCALEAREGMLSFLVGLSHDHSELMIGLDDSNAHIQRYREGYPPRTQRLCAYFTARTSPANLVSLQGYTHTDRFGTPGACNYVQIAEMPLLPTGEIDHHRLITLGHQPVEVSRARIAPGTDVEHTIAAIWQEVLQIEKVSVNDSFFELGGHSILVAQVHRKLQEVFHCNFMMVELIKYPTIAAFAYYISQQEDKTTTSQEIYLRTETRRVSLQGQRQLRQKAQKNVRGGVAHD